MAQDTYDAERFWQKVEKTESCWLWNAALGWNGYGSYYKQRAHRVAYQALVGPIPDGYELDHLCRTRNCVRPDHLEPVTREENQRRGDSVCTINARKTECKHGHPFTPENTYQDGRWRRCRTCREDARARHRLATLVSE